MFISNINKLSIKDSSDNIIYELDKPVDDDTYDMINDILQAVGVKIKKI